MARKLTIQQKLFCHELSIDPKRDQTQAAIRAGFSEKTAYSQGSRFMNSPHLKHVREYFDKLIKIQTDKLDVTAKYVIGNIKKIGEKCMNEDAILDDNGKKIGKRPFKETGALHSQKLLGDYLKIFTPDEGRETAVNVTVMPAIIIKGKEFKPQIGK